MSGRFHMDESAVAQLAGTFDQRQRIPAGLGGPLVESAGAVRTGDPALDARTKQLLSQYQDILTRIGELFGDTAGALIGVADAAGEFDTEHAAEHEGLVADG